jgi:hypothetical protein
MGFRDGIGRCVDEATGGAQIVRGGSGASLRLDNKAEDGCPRLLQQSKKDGASPKGR